MYLQTQSHSGNDQKKRRLTMDLLMKESDYNKEMREKENLVSELRRLRRKEIDLQNEIKEKSTLLHKLENNERINGLEIKRIKKMINNLKQEKYEE